MLNTMKINNHNAIISYDPELQLFRGEFIGLNGGADFYAADVESLKTQGAISLQEFLAVCEERGIEPYRHYSGRFNVRISPETHCAAVAAAAANKISLNEWINRAILGQLSAP